MKVFKTIVIAIIALFIITGCAQKTTIKAVKAAKISDKSIKNIGVMKFNSDYIAQSSQIDSEIANVKFDNKNYFNLVDRKNLEKVLKEKRLNDSGLVKLIKRNRSKGLAQIETLVTGKVNVDDVAKSTYYEQRTDYNRCIQSKKDKKGNYYCIKYRTYSVRCKANTYSVNSKIKVIRVSDAKTLFTNNYSQSKKLKKCSDQSTVLPTRRDQNTKLAANIAKQFIIDIAPSYIYFTAELMDDPDIEYTKKNEAYLKSALALIKNKRIKRANKLLKSLVKDTKNRSYVALYNLAVTEESLGNVKTALALYKRAEDITLSIGEIEENIAFGINRAEKNLIELEKTKKQI